MRSSVVALRASALRPPLRARLLGREGVLVCGPNVAERAAAFEVAGVPARLIGSDEQASVLPVFEPPDGEAVFDEFGGSTDVRAVIDGLAAALGHRLVRARVFDLHESRSSIKLHNSEGICS